MVVDSRNSSILPSGGGLLRVHQVGGSPRRSGPGGTPRSASALLQELAGWTGGDGRFLKEDFELQLNQTLLWGSVSPTVPPSLIVPLSISLDRLVVLQVLSGSLWGGLILPLGDKSISIADR